MAIDRGIEDWRALRPTLDELSWGDGLTRDEMLNQCAALRSKPDLRIMRLLPPDFRFPGPGAVMSYFEQLEREGQIQLEDRPAAVGYPSQSATGLTLPAHRYPPSVGSGAGSGSTGSSAQTGVGREGTGGDEK